MASVSSFMSRDLHVVDPQQTLQHAAELMRRLDVGSLPVVEGDRLLGIVTDRDLAVRGVAAGLSPASARVCEVMSGDVTCCAPDDDGDEVMQRMGQRQVRRLPVIDASMRLVGIVAMADLALRQTAPVDSTLREISTPLHPAAEAAPLHGATPAEHAPQMGVAME